MKTTLIIIATILITAYATLHALGYALAHVFGGPGRKYFCAALAILALSCEREYYTPSEDMPTQYTKYEVRKGKHDMKPNALQAAPMFDNFEHVWRCKIPASAWYPAADIPARNWNKVGGIGAYWKQNNQSTILLAWRPAVQENAFEFAWYLNDNRKTWTAGPVLTVQAMQAVTLIVSRQGRWVTATVCGPDGSQHSSTRYEEKNNLMRHRGAWFGGSSPAPKDLHIWVWQGRKL